MIHATYITYTRMSSEREAALMPTSARFKPPCWQQQLEFEWKTSDLLDMLKNAEQAVFW